MFKLLPCLLPALLFACDYTSPNYQPDDYYQVQEDICPSGFPASEAFYSISAGPMKVSLPTADFDMGTPQVTVALFDVDEKIELSLDGSMAILDFGRGVKEGLLNNEENTIIIERGDTGYIKGAGCNGVGNFNWFFERIADKTVITRDPNVPSSYTFQLMFKRSPDAFVNVYDYNITGSFLIDD